ncbi:MAG: helix-turn-helix domain-containing protein [Deltaproteobacteria bacterium]|nr:helix-turn-helix domain-containing protein [Deltaproteobacteria bacterium]
MRFNQQALLVGRKLRKLRKERKLTQTALAQRIGIQQSDLSRMEKGEYRVSLDTLFRILAEFEVSLAEFFHETEEESFSPSDMMLVRQFNALTGDAQDEVKAFMSFKGFRKEGKPSS